ncbi:succinylglutamate desuccinylase/aspartoacylase family protein [Caballeronia sp. 15715]|uniref:succinylglutamate desuccinylase/aspartoacylase family protein n=1 Tax=Caballeronia sp. 15715 TaxID=3391030 RepID=UPI0039E2DA0C
MNSTTHALPHATAGAAYHLTSHQFGTNSGQRKVYIQAGLHADETPGVMVALTLLEQLRRLEDDGKLRSEIVLVCNANPLGLSQWLFGAPVGRFEFASGRNYNRDFPMLASKIATALEGKLTQDADENLVIIRQAWKAALSAQRPATLFDGLQRQLMLLAHDADVVLDLHCSREAAMHIYTGQAIWAEAEPLARYLGAVASLLAYDSGASSFDEAQSLTWWQLKQQFGAHYPIPTGAVSVTVEHRGQRDVSYEMARQDAQAIIDYLTHQGFIDGIAPPLPELTGPATPLAGSEQFLAPASGILVHRAKLGDHIEVGQPLFDVIDTTSGSIITVHSKTRGVFYMRRDVRFVKHGDPLGRVTGVTPQRTGKLLGA